MGSCDHSILVDEPLCGLPHAVLVGPAENLIGNSLGEGCGKSVIEQRPSCLDMGCISLNFDGELTGQSVPEQKSCSDVSHTIYSSDVDTIDALDSDAGTCIVNRDGHENVVVLVSEKMLRDECGVGGLCLDERQGEIDLCHVETDELLHVTGSPNNCAQQNEQKDTLTSDGPSEERAMEVVEVESDVLDESKVDMHEPMSISQGCEMALKLLPMTGSLRNCAQQNEQKEWQSDSGSSEERVMEAVEEKNDVLAGMNNDMCNPIPSSQVCQMPSKLLQINSSLSNCAHQNEQKHTKSVDSESVNGPSAERFADVVEEKSDVLAGIKADTWNQISPIEENACNLKEGSSNITPNDAVEKPFSLQPCQPFDVVDNGSSKTLVVPDLSGTDVVIGAFNYSSAPDSSGQIDNEGKDKNRYDYASEAKCPDIICSSSRRSTRISKSNQKTQTEKAARKGRKTANNMPCSHGTIDLFLKAARRKRSCFCKPARSSIWGLLGNITQDFEQNNELGVNEVQRSRKARGGQRSGKRNKNRAGGGSRGSKGKQRASTSRIRLKVKVGKDVGQSSLAVMVPDAVDTLHPVHAMVSDYRPSSYLGTSLEFPKLANGVDDNLGEGVPGTRQLQCLNGNLGKEKTFPDASILDVHRSDKDLESAVILDKSAGKAADDYFGISSQTEAEALGGPIDSSGYLEPGTSPDSEVINLIPDAQDGARVQEELRNAVMTSSKCFVGSGDVTSSNLPKMSSKKGKKKAKLPRAGNCIVEDGLPGPPNINKARLSKKCGRRQKMEDGFYSSETFISSTSGNASSNMSSSEVFSKELLPLSGVTELGVSLEALKVESGTEANLYSSLDAGLGSSESWYSEKLLPSSETKGRKLPKSLKTSGVSKSRSGVPESARRRRGNACRQKESQRKSVNKGNIKEKGICDQVVCNVKSQPETGNHILDDLGKTSTGNKITPEDVANFDMVPSGVGEQYLPPRIAWVRCDDCHKWRCIPATLADSIEETNCKWTCKDNMDKAFADCSIPQEKSNAEINAELEISDASCEEDAYAARLNSKELEQRRSTVPQPSSWMVIKSNLFLHRSRKTQTIDEIMFCHCKPPLDGRLGCGDECLNRMLNIECVKGTCPCGELCSNQRFQKHKYAKLKWFRCGKKGYGLQLMEDISLGKFLIEYVGEVLDLHTYEARQRDYASRGHKHFYFMTLNGSEVIDACAKGNLGRFINHSCDPNCRTEKWMVNGEVCIGLFALRDIKKGEEVTFDYNYVRVFGAAAKKCVCGSSQCRGYIGGDPLNSEVIVQGDSDEEYPEPVMVHEDGETGDSLDNIISATSSFDGAEMQTAEILLKHGDKMDESAAAVGQLESATKNEDSMYRSASAVSQLQISLDMEDSMGKLLSSVQPVEISKQTEDVTSKALSVVQKETSMEEGTMNKSSCSIQRLETSSTATMLSDSVDTNRKSKSDAVEDKRVFLKPQPLMKTSRSSSAVKRGKSNSNPVNTNKPQVLANKFQLLSNKPKKLLEGSANGRSEGVEEKLNELLDADGGISKRKDAPKGYLKLLLLTAASGDSGNGEAIQSNRDLSMILDALLKTKSRVVLVDIINKNGLRLLHNIMKRYRRDFNKTPILRKLLKVLENLAVREILTLEHINGGPPCPGMESFRESILALAEHNDKQVHQIARNFRDRWIPRPVKKISCMDRDDGKMELHRGSNCSRFSASHNYWRDQGARPTEAIDCIKQSMLATNPVDAGSQEGCSAPCIGGCSTNGTITRKRKSRWDQPAEMNPDPRSPPNKEQKIQPSLVRKFESSSQPEFGETVLDHINRVSIEEKNGSGCVHNHSPQDDTIGADDGRQNIHEDVPPGFSSPRNTPLVPSSASTFIGLPQQNVSHSKYPFEVVAGHSQERFISRLPVSYGIPVSIVQQYGTPQAETMESWAIAPGMPFLPFPPLPPFSRAKRDPPPSHAVNPMTMNQPREEVPQERHGPAPYHTDQSAPSTSGASPPDGDIPGENNLHMFKRVKDSSHDLGRRYFRQQKWNNSKLRPPWPRKRNGWGFMGSNSRNGMDSVGIGNVAFELKSSYCSEDVSSRVEDADNTCYQHPQHQNQH